MRILHSVRNRIRKTRKKLDAIAEYMWNSMKPEERSIEKLYWMLFHADIKAYKNLGKPITGAAWMKTEDGPRPYYEYKPFRKTG